MLLYRHFEVTKVIAHSPSNVITVDSLQLCMNLLHKQLPRIRF